MNTKMNTEMNTIVQQPLVTVVNCQRCANDRPTYYIGRNRIPRNWMLRPVDLGNPYVLGQAGNRDQVCEQFKRDVLHNLWNDRLNTLFTYWKLDGFPPIALACWCSPQRCHGDTIAEWLMSRHKLEMAVSAS